MLIQVTVTLTKLDYLLALDQKEGTSSPGGSISATPFGSCASVRNFHGGDAVPVGGSGDDRSQALQLLTP
jgi:hypothetical protein